MKSCRVAGGGCKRTCAKEHTRVSGGTKIIYESIINVYVKKFWRWSSCPHKLRRRRWKHCELKMCVSLCIRQNYAVYSTQSMCEYPLTGCCHVHFCCQINPYWGKMSWGYHCYRRKSYRPALIFSINVLNRYWNLWLWVADLVSWQVWARFEILLRSDTTEETYFTPRNHISD